MQTMQDKTIKELAKECQTVEDVHKMLKNLFKDTLQGIFEAEMEEHLGYEKHDVEGNNTGNSRNGYSKKTIKQGLAKPNWPYRETVMGNLNLKLLKSMKQPLTNWKTRL